jgi:uncharacterized protein (TIGR01777 family)
MIGSAVKAAAEEAGHEVVVLHIPRPPKSTADDAEAWVKPLAGWTPQHFSDYDAVMFFGGEPINSRWTDKKVRRIELSRQMPCRRIAECCADAARPPRVIISASATGYYGDRGEDLLTEDAGPGTGILSPTTAAWEASWDKAREAGIRVVTLRLGVVLSPKGGALKVMIPAFKAGLGGPMGSGNQWMPWITLADVGRLVTWCLEQDNISGPVNAVSPEPVRQHVFAKALGQAVNRPAIVPAPEFALKLGFGRMAGETVLASCRAVPAKASENGFHFNDFEIGAALRGLVK